MMVYHQTKKERKKRDEHPSRTNMGIIIIVLTFEEIYHRRARGIVEKTPKKIIQDVSFGLEPDQLLIAMDSCQSSCWGKGVYYMTHQRLLQHVRWEHITGKHRDTQLLPIFSIPQIWNTI